MLKQAIQVHIGPITSAVGIQPNMEKATFDTKTQLPKNR